MAVDKNGEIVGSDGDGPIFAGSRIHLVGAVGECLAMNIGTV